MELSQVEKRQRGKRGQGIDQVRFKGPASGNCTLRRKTMTVGFRNQMRVHFGHLEQEQNLTDIFELMFGASYP